MTALFVRSWNSICRRSFLLVRLLGSDKRRKVKIPRLLKGMITKSENRTIFEFILNQCLSYALFLSVTTLKFSVELYNECHEYSLPLHSQFRRCLQNARVDRRASRKMRCIARDNENPEGKPYSYYTLHTSSHSGKSRHWIWHFWQHVVTEERKWLRGVHQCNWGRGRSVVKNVPS